MNVISSHGGSNDPPIQSIITGMKVPTMYIHEINSKCVGKVIRFHGMVSKASPKIRPVYKKAVFQCSNCGGKSVPIEQFNPFFLFKPLGKCQTCQIQSPTWIPDDCSSTFINSQDFTVQENQNDIPSHRIPSQIRCITYEDFLMNYVNCGDDVNIFGIVKLIRKDKSSFTFPYVEVLNIEKRRKELSEAEISNEDIIKIVELAHTPDLYELMIKSFAPSIFGCRKEKEAILHSIFGAPEEIKHDITIRGTIHLLMVGDPATAKSQLLRAAIKLAPKAMYAMGRGTSAAGLTAALSQNPDSKEWEISAGVLVLADEGIACIDEIDKMRDEDRVNMHEAMEQGTVTINKAGIHAILRAKASIISAANPALGRYDKAKSVFRNLGDFPPSLFSRFDLIYTLFDNPDEEIDEQVVTHIMSADTEAGLIPDDLFKKYIIYSKKINPKLSEEAKDYLKKYFVRIRNASIMATQKDVPFTFRQFEALRRLTLAHARMLLKEEADMSDVEVVEDLFDKFLKDVGHDIGGVETGDDKETRTTKEEIGNFILAFLQTNQKEVHITELKQEAKRKGIDSEMFRKMLTQLANQSLIYTPRPDWYKYTPQTTLG
jgi:replicative DNA helicase Mcm